MINRRARLAIASVLGAACPLIVLLLLFWGQIAFWVDRSSIENTLADRGYSETEIPRLNSVFIKAPPITLVSSSGRNMKLVIDRHSISFLGEGFTQDPKDQGIFRSKDITLLFSDSPANRCCFNRDELLAIRSSHGGWCVSEYLRNTDPFEVLRAVYTSRSEDVGNASDLCGKYKALYLFSVKRAVTWKVARSITEFRSPSMRAFLSGDIEDPKLLLEMYFPERRRFLSLDILRKGASSLSEVESIIASVNMDY